MTGRTLFRNDSPHTPPPFPRFSTFLLTVVHLHLCTLWCLLQGKTQSTHYTYAPSHDTYAPSHMHQPTHDTYTPSHMHQPTHNTCTITYAPSHMHQPTHDTYTPSYMHQPTHDTYTPSHMHHPHMTHTHRTKSMVFIIITCSMGGEEFNIITSFMALICRHIGARLQYESMEPSTNMADKLSD